MSNSHCQIKDIINNISFTMPNLHEINKINLLVEKINNAKYKKIIFYALGSSYAIINCNLAFYKNIASDFEIELICCFNSYIEQYFTSEIAKGSLIIFCSRSGETYEINHQLHILLQKKSLLATHVKNIIICTNIQNNSLRKIAYKFNLEIVSIATGICARFEPFNAIYFIIIKLINKSIDLVELKDKIKNELTVKYNHKWNFNTQIYKESLQRNDHIIVVFNNNFLLNGLVEWFKHLWYESFGAFDFNIKFENHSSFFHSSIEYYANHKNFKYLLFFINIENNKPQPDLKPIIELLDSKEIVHFIAGNLTVILIEIIQYLFLLAHNLHIDIFAQPHVDSYKNSFIIKNKEIVKLLLEELN